MSMKVERSTVDQVKNRLAALKKKQEEKERVEEFGEYGFALGRHFFLTSAGLGIVALALRQTTFYPDHNPHFSQSPHF